MSRRRMRLFDCSNSSCSIVTWSAYLCTSCADNNLLNSATPKRGQPMCWNSELSRTNQGKRTSNSETNRPIRTKTMGSANQHRMFFKKTMDHGGCSLVLLNAWIWLVYCLVLSKLHGFLSSCDLIGPPLPLDKPYDLIFSFPAPRTNNPIFT